MDKRWTGLLLAAAACAADPGGVTAAEDTAESVIGPPGTAMWNKAAQTPTLDHNFNFQGVAATPDGAAIAIAQGNGDTTFTDGTRLHLDGIPSDAGLAIMRFDINGRREWTVTAGPSGPQNSIEELVVAADGTIAVWGRGSADLGCGNDVDADYLSFYVTRLDATGACQFTHTLRTTGNSGFGAGGGVALDPITGDLITVTALVGDLQLDGETIWNGPVDDLESEVVLVRFDDGGELLDVAASAHGRLSVRDLGVDDAGRVTVSGTMYPGGGDLGDGTRVMPERMAAWIIGYSAAFERRWSHAWGQNADVLRMTVHPDGHIAVGGAFRGELDFGNTATSTPFASYDLYVVKLDADGNDLWNRHIWGDASLGGMELAFDPAGYVLAGGIASGGVLRIGSFRAVLDDSFTMWLTRLGTSTGSVVWARTYEGGSFTAPFGLSVPWNARRFYLIGAMTDFVDLGDDRGPLYATGGDASFIARMVK